MMMIIMDMVETMTEGVDLVEEIDLLIKML